MAVTVPTAVQMVILEIQLTLFALYAAALAKLVLNQHQPALLAIHLLFTTTISVYQVVPVATTIVMDNVYNAYHHVTHAAHLRPVYHVLTTIFTIIRAFKTARVVSIQISQVQVALHVKVNV
jgi:hypothetical protein